MSWKIKIPNYETIQIECPEDEDIFHYLMEKFSVRCRTFSDKKRIAYCEKVNLEKTNPAFKLPSKN